MGAEYGDTFQLVDVTGGSGQNPISDLTHTTSQFFVKDMDQFDLIDNIRLENGVKI